MLHSNDHVCLHSEKLNPDAIHYLIRMFASPAGPIDPESGQPWKPYFGTCLISDFAGVGEIRGAHALPRHSLGPMRELGRGLNLSHLWWQTWDERLMIKSSPTRLKL